MTRITFRLNSMVAALTLAATALAAPLAQAAETPAYDITGDATFFEDNDVTTGFIFTAKQNASLTALGFHDFNLDGLKLSHEVGLYSVDGDLLVKTTVAAGSAVPLTGQYRYTTLDSAYLLQAGTQYVLAAHTVTREDGYRYGNLPFTLNVNPLISIGAKAGVYTYGSSLDFPTTHFFDMYANPNMLLTTAVPEPAAWVLMFAGLALVAGLARRHHA
jgi:hypothetical protein